MVAAGQSKGRQTVMMGDVCEMQDGSLRSTKIRDACMYYGYEAGTLGYTQELQQERRRKHGRWSQAQTRKLNQSPRRGQGLSKGGVFISLLTL